MRLRDQRFGVLCREVRAQKRDGRQRECTFAQSIEDDRKRPHCPCDFDAVVSLVFREVQCVGAIREQGCKPVAQIQAASIDFAKQHEQVDDAPARIGSGANGGVDESAIWNVCERVDCHDRS